MDPPSLVLVTSSLLQERWVDFVHQKVAEWQQSLRFELKKDLHQ